MSQYPDAEVFHGSGWLSFLAASQQAEPVVAEVRADGLLVGHFVGAIVRRYGSRMLGSPMRGWGTEHMGFLLRDESFRRDAAEALVPFAFGQLGCIHLELSDRWLSPELMAGLPYEAEIGSTFVIDLSPTLDEVFSRLNSNTRQYVRRAAKRGIAVEIATELAFADEFYSQLLDVFAHQGLAPPYDLERVRHLIRALQPAEQILLVRVRAADGACIAAGISVGCNRTAVAWGAAFRRVDAAQHPNEPLWWETIRFWRGRGVETLDMGGRGDYKAKYGGVASPTAHFHCSKYRALRYGREMVRRIVRVRQSVVGRSAMWR